MAVGPDQDRASVANAVKLLPLAARHFAVSDRHRPLVGERLCRSAPLAAPRACQQHEAMSEEVEGRSVLVQPHVWCPGAGLRTWNEGGGSGAVRAIDEPEVDHLVAPV